MLLFPLHLLTSCPFCPLVNQDSLAAHANGCEWISIFSPIHQGSCPTAVIHSERPPPMWRKNGNTSENRWTLTPFTFTVISSRIFANVGEPTSDRTFPSLPQWLLVHLKIKLPGDSDTHKHPGIPWWQCTHLPDTTLTRQPLITGPHPQIPQLKKKGMQQKKASSHAVNKYAGFVDSGPEGATS